MNIFFHQGLETLVAFNGLLEMLYLIARNITGDVLTVLITLVIVIRPFGPLPDDAQRAFFQALDLSDLLEDRLGGGFRIHKPKYMSVTYTFNTKKTRKPKIEDF